MLFAGGLVFSERVPTTPHADFAAWLASLDALEQFASGAVKTVVPSHGPVHTGLAGVQQTRDWLQWLTSLHADQRPSAGSTSARCCAPRCPNVSNAGPRNPQSCTAA